MTTRITVTNTSENPSHIVDVFLVNDDGENLSDIERVIPPGESREFVLYQGHNVFVQERAK